MRRPRPGRVRGRLIPAFAACFVAGMIVGWWLRGGAPAPADTETRLEARDARLEPNSTRGTGAVATTGAREGGAVDALRRRSLRLPIEGADVERLKGMFAEARDGRAHDAVDILAPRNTPIHAVENGTVAKLFASKAGGLTIYQFDPTGRFCYYYAHLQRYADGLRDGARIERGDVIGYVGTSGNAPANTPHLHFAVFELGPNRRWWEGKPIDPYLVFRQ